MLRRHPGEGREGSIVLRRPCEGVAGLAFEQGQALGRRSAAVDPTHAAGLPIDNVVAMATPGVELARAVARRGGSNNRAAAAKLFDPASMLCRLASETVSLMSARRPQS